MDRHACTDQAADLARRAEELGLPLELFPPPPEPGERVYADFVDRSDPDGQPHRHPFLDTDIYHCSDPEGLVRRCLDAASSGDREVIVLDSLADDPVAGPGPDARHGAQGAQRTFSTGDVDEAVLHSGLPRGVAEDRAREADRVALKAGALAVHRVEPE